MVTRENDVVAESGNHSHQADVIQVKKDVLLSEVREMAVAGESTTQNIIGGAATVATNDVFARLPKKSSVERKIQRAQRSVDALVNSGNINFPV